MTSSGTAVRTPSPEEEIECYLLTRRETVPHEWMKEQIDYWLADLRESHG